MPIYEYECGGCSKVHEVSQRITDAPLTSCPECGGQLRKLISLSGFALKGSGFYTTDYKRSGSKDSSAAPAACSKPECTSN